MAQPLFVGAMMRTRIWCRTIASFGQAAVNTQWYKVAAIGATPATDQDVAATLDALVFADYIGLMNPLGEYRGVQAQICSNASPNAALFTEASTIVNTDFGTVTGNLLDTQTCGLIQYGTDIAGPRGRGRAYIPFPSDADNSGGGSPTTGYLTRLGVLAGHLASGLAVSQAGRTATLVRVLRHGKDKDGAFHLPDPVLTTGTSEVWATQRRRGGYGRQNRSPI